MKSERTNSFRIWDNVGSVIGVLIIAGCIVIIALSVNPHKSDTEKAIEIELSLK